MQKEAEELKKIAIRWCLGCEGRGKELQYKVPQNIDLEDKIVGPFTLKQFIYLLVSGSIIYGWWSYLSSNYIEGTYTITFVLVAIPVGLLGAALALVKVNDRPFEVFLLNLLRFIVSPKQRMWKEGFKSEPVIIVDKTEAPKAEKVAKDTGSLDDLAKSLEDQTEKLKAEEAPQTKIRKNPVSQTKNPLNLSVTDVEGAAKAQVQAQKKDVQAKTVAAAPKAEPPAAEPKKKGIVNFLKGI